MLTLLHSEQPKLHSFGCSEGKRVKVYEYVLRACNSVVYIFASLLNADPLLTILHTERPKLYAILVFLSAVLNPTALRNGIFICNFGLSECST